MPVREIIDILLEDGRATPEKIAVMTGLDAGVVREKIAEWERGGVIRRYKAGAALANIGTSGSSRCMLGGSGRLGLLVLFGRDGVLSVLVAGVAVIVLLTAV